MDVISAWKRIGETPLQTMKRVRADYGIPNEIKGCYTGRLDPMAQGLMTFLFGDQIHQSHSYNQSDKRYQFQAVLGLSTSSYDPLGRITNIREINSVEAKRFLNRIIELSGETVQVLPPCSAYRHNGKPLWLHALNGTLPVPLPTKKVKVYNIRALHPYPTRIDLQQYRRDVLNDINDFREGNANNGFKFDDIIEDWNGVAGIDLYRIGLEANVGTGTFVRSLVYDTACELSIPAHTFRITRVGIRKN